MELIEDFIGHLQFEKRYSEHTLIAYHQDLAQFFEELNIESLQDIQIITNKDIRRYIVNLLDLGLENTSVNRKISTLKSYFKFLIANDLLEFNPTQLIKSLKTKKRLPQFVPEQQLWEKEIFQEEKSETEALQVELIFELFYQTGIRLSELIHLENKNISEKQIKVLGKRNKERIIPISNDLSKLIIEYQNRKLNIWENSQFLISDKNGKKRTPKFVYNKVNYYLGKATNLKKRSPHVLRHTFATHMLNNGASIESIKTLLGHADLTATQVYTHNSFKQLKSVYKQTHPRGN